MKKQTYQKPAMRVVKLQQQTHLLADSGVDATRNGYGAAQEEEWG